MTFEKDIVKTPNVTGSLRKDGVGIDADTALEKLVCF